MGRGIPQAISPSPGIRSSTWYRRSVEAPEVLARVGAAVAGITATLLAVRDATRTFVFPRPARADHGGSA